MRYLEKDCASCKGGCEVVSFVDLACLSSSEAAMETSTVRERLKKLKELQESKSKPSFARHTTAVKLLRGHCAC